MKKIIGLLLSLVLVTGLTGCGKENHYIKRTETMKYYKLIEKDAEEQIDSVLEFYYDVDGKILREVSYSFWDEGIHLNSCTEFSYNDNNVMDKIISYEVRNGQTSPADCVYRDVYEIDENGKVINALFEVNFGDDDWRAKPLDGISIDEIDIDKFHIRTMEEVLDAALADFNKEYDEDGKLTKIYGFDKFQYNINVYYEYEYAEK